MRRVVLDSLMSLDGYYTDSKNQIEWFLPFEEEDLAWSHEILTSAGLLVLGRTTYDEFSRFFPTLDADATGWDPYVVEQLNRLPKVVFSTTLNDAEWKPSTIVRTDPTQEIARLKQGTGKDIEIIGSGSIAAAAIRAGLIDEYRIRIQPIILGSGKLLFQNQDEQRRLTLLEVKSFKSGVTALHYIPRGEK